MFFIVRHGNTFDEDTPPRRIGSRTDLPLTSKGLEQGAALGRYFAGQGVRFAKVLVSPLIRTRQTATAILDHQPQSPAMQDAVFLKEIDHGPDENQVEEAVLRRIGEDALLAWDRHALAPDGWVVEPEQRMEAWRDLFAQVDSEAATLLVTSNGAARFALLADEGLREQAATLDLLKLPTGGFGVIASEQGGKLMLREWGRRP